MQMYAKSPGETTAGTLSCLMPVFLDFLHGYEFQSQFADERLDLLPVLHGKVFQRSLVLSFLLPAHGDSVLWSSRPAVVMVLLLFLFGFDKLCFLGRLVLVLLNRLVAICLR